MPHQPRTQSQLLPLLLIALPSVMQSAEPVPLGDTGYTLSPPANWTAGPASGDMVFRCLAPGQNGFLEVYTGTGTMGRPAMAQGYDQRMQMAAKGWQRQHEQTIQVAGAEALYRSYAGQENGIAIHVQAIFYCKENRTFILHAVTAAQMYNQLFQPAQQALLSLGSPPRSQTGLGGVRPAATQAQPKPIRLGDTALHMVPPTGWTSKPASEQGMVLCLASPDQMGAINVYDFGKTDAKVSVTAALDHLAKSFVQAMGASDQGWKLVEDQRLESGTRQGVFRHYETPAQGGPTDVQAFTLIADRKMIVAYAITAKEARAQYLQPVRQSLLSVLGGAPEASTDSVTQTSAPLSLFATVQIDDVDLLMPIEEKSYLNELDEVQKRIIQRTYQGK